MNDKLIVLVLAGGAFVGGAIGLLAALPDGFFTFHMHSHSAYSDPAREVAGITFGGGSGIVAGAIWLLVMWRIARNADGGKIILCGTALGCGVGALAGMLMQLGLSVMTHSSLIGPLLAGFVFGTAGGLPTGLLCGFTLWWQRGE